jgi:phosphohistidine phosphatase
MKNLYLLRHANTYPNTESDKARILTAKGIKEIRSISQQELLKNSTIDIVLCSTANRTIQTMHHLEDFLYTNFSIELQDVLYNPTVQACISIILEIQNHLSNAMIISHNPALSELANYLVKDQNISFGTANLAKIELNIDAWSELKEGCGVLKWMIKPDLL